MRSKKKNKKVVQEVHEEMGGHVQEDDEPIISLNEFQRAKFVERI